MKPMPLVVIKANLVAAYRVILVGLLVLGLNGCQQEMDISDQELIEKIEECLTVEEKSPGMAVACGNYQRECERRGKATGNYFC